MVINCHMWVIDYNMGHVQKKLVFFIGNRLPGLGNRLPPLNF